MTMYFAIYEFLSLHIVTFFFRVIFLGWEVTDFIMCLRALFHWLLAEYSNWLRLLLKADLT